MIVSFSVGNYRSFAEEETFSLVASKRFADNHSTHLIPVPDTNEHVLKTAVLYGANGSGKSNLFKALRFLKKIALETRAKNSGLGREAFRFADNMVKLPSSFDLQFIAEDKLWRFGCVIDDKHIVEEWLVQVVGGREKIIYERVTNEQGKVHIEAKEAKVISEKFAALVTVGAPQNQSFLATIHANLDKEEIKGSIENVLNWFDALTLIAPNESFIPIGHILSNDETFRQFAGEFLESSATGVSAIDVQKQEISEDELRTVLPESLISTLLIENDKKEEIAALLSFGEGKELLVEHTDQRCYYLLKVQAIHNHKNQTKRLELSDESDGTCRLLNLIPALHHLRNDNAVYFIDEIDRSMHPMLSKAFLDFFLKSCPNGQHQVIVTTHESNLLDLDLLRRDEIWFSEKDQLGATHLYSLADFKIRKDLEIRKHYLQGRFGAIPFLGNLESLLEKQDGVDAA